MDSRFSAGDLPPGYEQVRRIAPPGLRVRYDVNRHWRWDHYLQYITEARGTVRDLAPACFWNWAYCRMHGPADISPARGQWVLDPKGVATPDLIAVFESAASGFSTDELTDRAAAWVVRVDPWDYFVAATPGVIRDAEPATAAGAWIKHRQWFALVHLDAAPVRWWQWSRFEAWTAEITGPQARMDPATYEPPWIALAHSWTPPADLD